MKKTKYLSKELLMRYGKETISPVQEALIAKDSVYPITLASLSGDDKSVMCRVILNADADAAYVRIPLDEFNNLPAVTAKRVF